MSLIPPSLARRFGAILYDSLLLIALLFAATALLLAVRHGAPIAADGIAYRLFLLAIAFLYFGWFWTHGGQTLGMRAWRLRLRSDDGGSPTWQQATVRYIAAILSWAALGLGFLWALRGGRCWHDGLSHTRLGWADE